MCPLEEETEKGGNKCLRGMPEAAQTSRRTFSTTRELGNEGRHLGRYGSSYDAFLTPCPFFDKDKDGAKVSRLRGVDGVHEEWQTLEAHKRPDSGIITPTSRPNLVRFYKLWPRPDSLSASTKQVLG